MTKKEMQGASEAAGAQERPGEENDRGIRTKRLSDSPEDLRAAARIIADGGLVAFPTETVYGLGADALNPEAVKKIYEVKGRPADNPSIVHIAKNEDLPKLTTEVTRDMEILRDRFWPGPMTMITKRRPIIPDVTTGGLDTVGIRMPESRIARELIEQSGCAIAAPSANLSGKPSPTEARHVLHDLDGRIDAVIDGGPCRVGIESTVIDMTEDTPMILRPGILTREDFEEALGKPVLLDPSLNARPDPGAAKKLKPRAPGMKYKHYAPDAKMILFEGEPSAVAEEIERERRELEKQGLSVMVIEFTEAQEKEAAHEIFRRLRQADEEGDDVILAAALPEEGVGFSVMNRMLKSAGFNIRKVEK